MVRAREIVSLGLAERAKAGIKVRQPLQELQIKDIISKELLELIKEEINVKEISFGKDLKLNTEITPELKEEGMVREVIRQIQEMRKKSGLKPQDKISVWYSGSSELASILAKNKKAVLLETKAEVFESTQVAPQKSIASNEITINQQKLCLYLEAKNKFQ